MSPASDETRMRIDELVKRYHEGGGAADEEFVRRYLLALPRTDLFAPDAERCFEPIDSLWSLAESRSPGEALVRARVEEEDGPLVIEIVNDDMPFLVGSVLGVLHQRGHGVRLLAHPIVQREVEGEARDESLMRIELDPLVSDKERDSLVAELENALRDVRLSVQDWSVMRDQLLAQVDELTAVPPRGDSDKTEEGFRFLRWLAEDHFTFLGYRRYEAVREGRSLRLVPDESSGLGVLRGLSDQSRARSEQPLPPAVAARWDEAEDWLLVSKASRRSTVHRPVHMDMVSLRRFDEGGNPVEEHRFLGLLTSMAYALSVDRIPLIRQKVRRVEEGAGLVPGSHDYKALQHILQDYPRDELFQISEAELGRTSQGILQLEYRERVALFARRDDLERFVSCLVFVPRDDYSSRLRERLRAILEQAYGGEVTAFYTRIGDTRLARTHFIVKTTPGQALQPDPVALEAELAHASRSWAENLRRALAERGAEALATFPRWKDAFPFAYREAHSAEEAVGVIEELEGLLISSEPVAAHLDPELGRSGPGLSDRLEAEGYLSLRFLARGDAVPLSDILPILEAMGVKVHSEVPWEIHPESTEPIWIHEFSLQAQELESATVDEVRAEFERALVEARQGRVESDELNQLILRSGLATREVVLLRAVWRYLRQVGISFSRRYAAHVLVSNPRVVRALIDLFRAGHDPDLAEREKAIFAAEDELKAALDTIVSLDEDRILRRIANVLRSMLRTNFFQTDELGRAKPYLSFKLDGKALTDLPAPRPRYEIFVYSPEMEGVHLRGGPVARGGIRWSDRREDFRTEILGLVKAQMVKNAVIVPVGAKGGFVIKRPPEGGREALLAAGQACYRTLIRGLLDVTDNWVDGQIAPPQRVVRHDGDDPYLVVAADKGTATFSDLANSVAAEYDFWLGDAFASGGSAGYDHKAMGITARGAWEAVKRHFREVDRDIQSQAFTAVGVGDMSGDVFGNGMLLSRCTRLVAAFNHLHVFVDPDPDPERSWVERKRLFELPRSTWEDYDADAISAGGGVFARATKSIALSPEMKELLQVEVESLSPNELIRKLLTLPVDLLWFGGIGTFVKASGETHADVGDRANDALRVDGRDLRCAVVGEGANLGVTQRGRVELARGGGRLNTDAIDNSGGVDCSDHEVNIKILLTEALRTGDLASAERNPLLGSMTDEVAELVLENNYRQPLAISLAARPEDLPTQARLLRFLERHAGLDRELEFLPDDAGLRERAGEGEGLTRPELAVMLAYAKIHLFQSLAKSRSLDDPVLEDDLAAYFPRVLSERFPAALADHRLRREIIATYLTNEVIDRCGPSFVMERLDEAGGDPDTVVQAFLIAREVLELPRRWASVDALDLVVPHEVQSVLYRDLAELTARVCRWLLARGWSDRDQLAREMGPGIGQLARELPELLPASGQRVLRRRLRDLEKHGVDRQVALDLSVLPALAPVCDVVALAAAHHREVGEVARAYFNLGSVVGLDWLRRAARRLEPEGVWPRRAHELQIEDLFRLQRDLTASCLAAAGREASWKEAIARWRRQHAAALAQGRELLDELRASGPFELPKLTVAIQQLRALAGRAAIPGAEP